MVIDFTLLYVIIPVVLTILAIYFIHGRCFYGEPNEWVVVIKNGTMKCAGIGLQGIRGFNEQVVKFPSTINKVNFKAEQVTKEMQGIKVTGFIIWSIYRDKDGPFKAYKMLNGISESAENANENVARMAESIVRHRIANLTIQEVITQRHQIRDAMREEMLEITAGWGIWLETCEITDVFVLSKSLFENMQTEFRQSARKEAELIKAQTNREIKEKEMEVSTALDIEKSDAQTKTKVYKAKQKLTQEQEEEKLELERLRIKQAQLEQEKQLQITRNRNEAELRRLELEEQEKVKALALEADIRRIDLLEKKQEREQELAMKLHRQTLARELVSEEQRLKLLGNEMDIENKYPMMKQLDTVKEVYRSVGQVKVVNIGGQDGSDSLLSRVMTSLRTIDNAIANE